MKVEIIKRKVCNPLIYRGGMKMRLQEREKRFREASDKATEIAKALTGYDNDELGMKLMHDANAYNAYNLLKDMIMKLNDSPVK